MTKTLIYFHHDCELHAPGAEHPERPERVKAILSYLKHSDLQGLVYREAPKATVEQLSRVHPRNHVDSILNKVPPSGMVSLDPDTRLSPGSGNAALRAAGAVCLALDEVINGPIQTAFCVTRPPGHHAESNRAMGFCLFNNVAIGAQHVRKKHGIQRVAIVDFDVHHGNGTQQIFEDDSDTLYVSSHETPLFPGTGSHYEKGAGNISNIPLSPGTSSANFRQKWEQYGIPQLNSFSPELVMFSAGFDAHGDDPLATMQLNSEDFSWLTKRVRSATQHSTHERIVSTLEGGYNLQALCRGAAAHIQALTEAI